MLDDGMFDGRFHPSDDEFGDLTGATRDPWSFRNLTIPHELINLAVALKSFDPLECDPLVARLLVQSAYDRDDFVAGFPQESFGGMFIFTAELSEVSEHIQVTEEDRLPIQKLAAYLRTAREVEATFTLLKRLDYTRELLAEIDSETIFPFADFTVVLEERVFRRVFWESSIESFEDAVRGFEQFVTEIKSSTLPKLLELREGDNSHHRYTFERSISLFELLLSEADQVEVLLRHSLNGNGPCGELEHYVSEKNREITELAQEVYALCEEGSLFVDEEEREVARHFTQIVYDNYTQKMRDPHIRKASAEGEAIKALEQDITQSWKAFCCGEVPTEEDIEALCNLASRVCC